MECYPAVKKNEIISFEATYMDLEIIIPSEVGQWKTNIIWNHLYVEPKKRVRMNLFVEQKQTHRHWKETYGYQRQQVWGGRRDGLGSLGLAYAHWGIWNDYPTGTCCIAQGTLLNILWQSTWKKNLKENGGVYMDHWITFLYRRSYHNLVNQLYFNETLKKEVGFVYICMYIGVCIYVYSIFFYFGK